MLETNGFWIFMAVLTLCVTGLIAYAIWLKHIEPDGEYRKTIADLRAEMSALAMAIGLQKRQQQAPRFGPPPVGP